MPQQRRQRLATQAASALAKWAIDTIGLHRLELVHSVRNPESCKVALAAGFDIEGIKRRLQQHEDGWHDMCLHSRISEAPTPVPESGPVKFRMRVAARLERSVRTEVAGGRSVELATNRR
jgi:hypothetical protein